MMKILLIEDHFLVRMSQKIVLNELYPQTTIVEADSFESGIAHVQGSPFDLILLDIDIPGGKGKLMIERIRQWRPEVVILMCSAADEQTHALEYITAGANGYLSKSAERNEMITAITTVMKKKRYVSLTVQERLLDTVSTGISGGKTRKTPLGLSEREREVMNMLIKGKWVKEIALDLNLRSNTVSTFKARIFQKMGVTSVLELSKKVGD
ncbi:two component transcriptional regulator, LuxR family [Dyadobacter sp. SG02]|uniref:response regulator n=1 Tax=Dyadobacter sp. SG02 TaxID=1855291 RepID=UPI0008B17E47|nr:response regulator transcription factor [Dyadobacter sp. SG02]SEJ37856.1 two component transcriptional regulator, LuxR family [Dyadobacter sp. SG02]